MIYGIHWFCSVEGINALAISGNMWARKMSKWSCYGMNYFL